MYGEGFYTQKRLVIESLPDMTIIACNAWQLLLLVWLKHHQAYFAYMSNALLGAFCGEL